MYYSTTSLPDLQDYLYGAALVSFDFETAPDEQWRHEPKAALDPHKAHIVGISFSVAEGNAVYVPIAHKIGENAAPLTELWQWLADNFFASKTVIKVAHNLAFESAFLYAHDIVLQEPVYDTIVAAQMTLKSSTQFRGLGDSGLKTLVPQLLGDELPSFEAVTSGRQMNCCVNSSFTLVHPVNCSVNCRSQSFTFDEFDPAYSDVLNYACADADYTLRLYHLFNNWFDRWLPRHRWIVENIESPTAVYCGLMRCNGLLVDAELMTAKAAECEERLAKLREEIAFIIGDVNIGANCSTSAFKKYLYGDLELPVLKTTAKYQEAADEEAFILLKEWCRENRPELEKLFDLVLEYRSIGKVKSTYIDGYMKHINAATGRIHPQLLPLGADSGRFSCRQPNIQNQKNCSNDGLNVRDFIIASHGHSLIELDYSQIEARLAAYLSRDDRLLNVFRRGEDLHAMTTAAVYGIPQAEAADKKHPEYKRRRTVAKMAFFGFLYGIYAKSLRRNLKVDAGIDMSIERCKDFLLNLSRYYPALAAWQKTVIADSKRGCCAETVFGRRRYLPLIRSNDFIKRGNAERAALNHGVQGLSADLLKLAMGRLLSVLPPYLKPLFTVHDSLVFECPDEKLPEAAEVVRQAMEAEPPIPGFDIPVIAEVSFGKSYGKMEEAPA
ncbi:MAG: DNA polymerase [Oscillospiraceae bacterium]|nr:DNA polymerase [Oscillospiraceae bacterium]